MFYKVEEWQFLQNIDISDKTISCSLSIDIEWSPWFFYLWIYIWWTIPDYFLNSTAILITFHIVIIHKLAIISQLVIIAKLVFKHLPNPYHLSQIENYFRALPYVTSFDPLSFPKYHHCKGAI